MDADLHAAPIFPASDPNMRPGGYALTVVAYNDRHSILATHYVHMAPIMDPLPLEGPAR